MVDFVEVEVTSTGQRQLVPEDWIGHPVLDTGFKRVKSDPAPLPEPEPPAARPTVQTVTSEADTQPIIPMYRDDFVDPSAPLELPTESNTHAEINDFALKHHVDLGPAADGTKAEKVAAIYEALTHETPATGDKES